jgi:hypothetical protein
MTLIETFITFAIGTTAIGSTLPTGDTVITLAIGAKLTTTITSITASTTDLGIPGTAAPSVSTPVVLADSMAVKASMEEAARPARTEREAEAFMVVEAEGFMVAEEEATTKT